MKYVTRKGLTPSIIWYMIKSRKIELYHYDEFINQAIRFNEWNDVIEGLKYYIKESMTYLTTNEWERKMIVAQRRNNQKLLSLILTKIAEPENSDLLDRIESLEIELDYVKRNYKKK